jgi:plasminogen activator inhibitor 1 RNA-binding protein
MKNTGDNGAPARGRGGRGGRGGRREFERRDATGKEYASIQHYTEFVELLLILLCSEHEKQANLAWGSNEGNSEWNDELAGAEIAQKELTDAAPDVAAEVTETPEEEETKTKTYDEYKAELAARQAELGRPTEIRKPNEGARNDKKWAAAKELSKEEEAAYFAGESKDKTRTRERKTKQFVEVETRFVEPRENRPRGGGERGERGDRGGRGGRGDRGDRPRGGRGGDRGDRSAPRGGDRAPRGDRRPARAPGAPVNVKDEAAFPSLGA